MSIEDDIACLEEVPTFRLLGPNALRILAIGCESSALDEGEVLFAAGDPADCGYVMQDGSFQIETGTGRANEPSVMMIIDTTRPVTATAAEPSTVCAFPAICSQDAGGISRGRATPSRPHGGPSPGNGRGDFARARDARPRTGAGGGVRALPLRRILRRRRGTLIPTTFEL